MHVTLLMNKFLFRVVMVSLLFFVAVSHPALAQLDAKNLSTLSVDQLSDQQLSQLMQQAKTSGLTDEQVVAQARQRGLPASEAGKLSSRIAIIRSQQATVTDPATVVTKRSLSNQTDSLSTPVKQVNPFASLQLPVFGADLFSNNNLTFEPNLNLPTPVNYVLGPNDQLNVNVYGNSLVNWKLNVSPEGSINIPGVGILNVAGQTIEQATSSIKAKLAANNYAIGRGTSVQVTLGDIRSIKIIMSGQLAKPGTYTLSSLATAFNALYAAGGPGVNGTFRDIQIIRNGRIVRRLDIYDFLTTGNQKGNIGLRDQDIIYVPTYKTRVSLTGQVKIPAYFEVLPGETLRDVIRFAGGFTDAAYTARVQVSQIVDEQRRLTDIQENDFDTYRPLRGDQFVVGQILNRVENQLLVQGAVFRPGVFELSKGLTLSQLIAKAGGLREDAFMNRGTIVRLKPDNTTESIAFNVRDVVNKVSDIALQREDVVTIPSIFDLRDQYSVIINGVRSPGTYPYADSMRVEDLIIRAGGLPEGASTRRLEVARRVTDADPLSKSTKVAQVYSININGRLTPEQGNFVLRPFDVVSIYQLPGYETQRTVSVEGEVLYPGVYTIERKNEKISDLIKRAGGLTASADADGGTLKRLNSSILGIDPSRADTAAIARERRGQLDRLEQISGTPGYRNNNVGIDLKDIISSPGSGSDLLLEDRDVLRIPKRQQIVRINGEVLYPSAVVYSSGKSFKGYVSNAGGYTPYAIPRRAYVVYPNGTVKATHKFLFFKSHPSVKPGSEIFVPREPVKIPSNVAQTVIGYTTGLASLGAIILGLISLRK